MKRRKLDVMLRQGAFYDVERAGASFAEDKRNVRQIFGSQFVGNGKLALGMYYGNQFIFQKRSIFQVGRTVDTFHQSQIDTMFLQSSLYLTRVPVHQRKVYLRKLLDEPGKQRRQNVLGYRSTGSQTQLSRIFVIQQMHLILQPFVVFQNPVAMFQQ